MSSFRVISHEFSNVGKVIKRTKKKFYWKFLLDEETHDITMFFSRLSGKLKILLDGDIQIDTYRFTNTKEDYRVYLETEIVLIKDLGRLKFDLMYEGRRFSLLTTEENAEKNSKERLSLRNNPPVLNIQESNIEQDMLRPSTTKYLGAKYSNPFRNSLDVMHSSISDKQGFQTPSAGPRHFFEKQRHSLQFQERDIQKYKNLTSSRHNPSK